MFGSQVKNNNLKSNYRVVKNVLTNFNFYYKFDIII